ncbi:hypothetical protein Cpir12675_005179 [Ceratocystis pirilliformis]|uniref:Zn(2)-C6 fungal-type domain-containing protein n=1 Tax=Ceratocystis pirilliformis TaxID=259994 RepID=A0ABR3YUI3_9PEZI
MSYADAMIGGRDSFDRRSYPHHQPSPSAAPTSEEKYRVSTRLPELSSLLNTTNNGPLPSGADANAHNSPVHSPPVPLHRHHDHNPRSSWNMSQYQQRPPHGSEAEGREMTRPYDQNPYGPRPAPGPGLPGPAPPVEQPGYAAVNQHRPPGYPRQPYPHGPLPMHQPPQHEQERNPNYGYPEPSCTPPPPSNTAPPSYPSGPYTMPAPHHMAQQDQQPHQGSPSVMPVGHYPPQPSMPQAAPQPQGQPPRQRTSIACRYCRKRKIRCSGYANSPGGRCMNCTRMNQECVFQPVSSTGTNAAFVHISALQGTVPVGTPVFGAYGQLVHQSPPQNSSRPDGPPNTTGPPPPSQQPPQQHPSYYSSNEAAYRMRHTQNGPSSTGSLSPSRNNKRSTSPNIPEGHDRRMPPPPADPRAGPLRSGIQPRPPGGIESGFYAPRGSPSMSSASMSHHGSPSMGPLPPTTAPSAFPPMGPPALGYAAGSHSNSSGSPAPSPPPAPSSSVMKVSSLLDDNNKSVDRGMLNRLGRGGLR